MSPPTATETFETWFARQDLQYFTARELTWYFTKVRNGISNTPPPRELWVNIIPTLHILDELRHLLKVPITITSTYRALKYNRTINSPDGSLHRQFRAVDFTVKSVPSSQVFRILKEWRQEKRWVGGLGKYPSFTHIDTRSNNATW